MRTPIFYGLRYLANRYIIDEENFRHIIDIKKI